MASRRPTAQEMTERVVARILDHLREVIPKFSGSPRATIFEAQTTIRDGIPQRTYFRTWDECRAAVHHAEPGGIAEKLQQVEKGLYQSLVARVVRGFHGEVIVTVSLKQQTLAISSEVISQCQYDWVGV